MTQPTTPRRDGPGGSPEGQHAGLTAEPRPLRRTPRQKVLAGVCGGLGRHYDIDPVIFRIVVGVLALTGGVGLIFYGFAWLLVPLDGDEDSEGRRLLSGRVEGAALTAVFLALIGCGLFLTLLNNAGVVTFALLLAATTAGAAVWSRRRTVAPDSHPLDPAAAHVVADAPPEATAPPAPAGPSWWRDPVVKDTEPATDYLWGPSDAVDGTPSRDARRPGSGKCRGPRGLANATSTAALIAGFLGSRLSWEGSPLGTSLQIGLACALGVFGLGMAISSFLGRTGFGTLLMTLVTAVLLAGASILPKDISTEWAQARWTPPSAAAVQERYELGTGVGTLDLRGIGVPAGSTVSTAAEVGAGRLKVLIPRSVSVTVRAEAGLGAIRLPGDAKNDIDISPEQDRHATLPAPRGAAPSGTLELRLEVGVGQLEVIRGS
ncbi:PspC domain-containing protein [Streptomyces yaizuensis]|uniref:PspC domain-containing protein n=1 Tax=Streptomyces yaizuensis TaxID=2989713 RepID=A0ABQ5P4Y1_9ACTN|nr:PspC domain-containing protein [Streptomyces sp. YSPA8]GLF97648.1 PspC domain-containing protein [Streptomyces sp. YSPA8]